MNNHLIPAEIIEKKIFIFRNKKVMLDRDLAELYGVETKVLNQAVKRNIRRFPLEFMFQISKAEFTILKSQFVTSSWGGARKLPFVFTQEGVAMLSSVLNSERAIMVNIQIMKTFVRLRELAVTHNDLREKIDAMEKKYDEQFQVVFDNLRELLNEPKQKMKKIKGFLPNKTLS